MNVEMDTLHRAQANVAGGPGCNIDLTQEGPWTLEEEAQRVSLLAAGIGGYTDLEKVTLHSNARNIDNIVDIINRNRDTPHSESMTGRLVPEGHICFAEKNGITTAVGPGRYRLWNPRAGWVSSAQPIKEHIKTGPITIMRVPNGHYGKVYRGNEPLLVSPKDGGLYVENSAQFRFEAMVRIDEPYIQHGTIHIVRVPKGQYGCVRQNNVPALLPPGIHAFKTNDFKVVKFVNLSDNALSFETITRFFVPQGSIGMAWRDSQPAFFTERGVYLVDSPMFRYVANTPVDNPRIELGSKKIITVKDGVVGVSHDHGKLKILPPGRHIIDDEGHHFNEFLSTQQQSLTLSKDDTHNDSLMVCESRELVRIGIQASVFYNIKDPALAVVKIGERKAIERFINETATAVITTIIRTTSLAEIAQSGHAKPEVRQPASAKEQSPPPFGRQESEALAADGKKRNEEKEDDDFAPNLPFFDRMHSDFIGRLQDNFLLDYGIYMLNIRIGDFKVLDEDISQSIANHASTTAATQAKLANLEGNRQIDLVNKDSDARIDRIQAEVDANKVTTTARAQAMAMREKASANAETMRIEASARTDTMKMEAEAKAMSIRIIAEAEAEAMRLKANAAAERAQKLGEVPFGREVTLAEIQAGMVQGSLEGVSKVVYLPTEMQNNPFSLFSRDQLANAAGALGAGK